MRPISKREVGLDVGVRKVELGNQAECSPKGYSFGVGEDEFNAMNRIDED